MSPQSYRLVNLFIQWEKTMQMEHRVLNKRLCFLPTNYWKLGTASCAVLALTVFQSACINTRYALMELFSMLFGRELLRVSQS